MDLSTFIINFNFDIVMDYRHNYLRLNFNDTVIYH